MSRKPTNQVYVFVLTSKDWSPLNHDILLSFFLTLQHLHYCLSNFDYVLVIAYQVITDIMKDE